jgi:acetyltransferase-like isoleucine patch superfamily enzyme
MMIKLKITSSIFRFFKQKQKSMFKKIKTYFDDKFLKKKGVDAVPGSVTLAGRPIIQKHVNSIIQIEEGVTLVSNPKINVAGINHPVVLATLSENAKIHIGKDSGLSGVTICAAKSVTIGIYVGLGANVSIYDTDFHPIDPFERRYEDYKTKSSPVIIDDYAWIGGNSIILKGVRIGKASVVGAGSVVTKNVPDFEIHAGNPAKFVRKINYIYETHHHLFNPSSK